MLQDVLAQFEYAKRRHCLYDSLKVKSRPRYVFEGRSRHDYTFLFPRKKTIAVFYMGAKGIGRRSFPIIMGGSPDTYYVKNGGDDEVDGLSDANAWATTAKATAGSYTAGDEILFKRGSLWTTAPLTITANGTEGSPIVIGAYGTGSMPDFSVSGAGENAVVLDGDWISVENVFVSGAPVAAVRLGIGSDNCTVSDCELQNSGYGVRSLGINSLITRCNIHDLIMVTNTPNPTNDDTGAVGVAIFRSTPEISWCQFINCQASSYDYYYDGAAIEIYEGSSNVCDNAYIHHNIATGCNGFIEVGGDGTGSVSNARMAYNLSYENWWLGQWLTSGPFFAAISNFRVENNTVYQIANMYDARLEPIIILTEDIASSVLKLKNNIFYVDGDAAGQWDISDAFTGFEHTYNLYHLLNGAALNFTADGTEILDDPEFLAPGSDFHLGSASPAIGAGFQISDYTVDLDGIPLGRGTNPEIGAFETLKGGPRRL